MEPRKLFCPQCGRPLEADAVFCPSCGHKIDQTRTGVVGTGAADGRPGGTFSGITAMAKRHWDTVRGKFMALPRRTRVAGTAAAATVAVAAFVVVAYIIPHMPETCYYTLSEIEIYNSDGEREQTIEYDLGKGGTITSSRNGYSFSSSEEDTSYEVNEQYGISIPLNDDQDSVDLKVLRADEFGQPTEFTYNLEDDGSVVMRTKISYYDRGRAKKITRELHYPDTGSSTTYEVIDFDEDGLIVSHSVPGEDTSYSYDYEYDDEGRVEKCTTTTDYGAEFVNEYKYDENGKVKEETTADGTTFRYEYERISDPSPYVAASNHGPFYGPFYDPF